MELEQAWAQFGRVNKAWAHHSRTDRRIDIEVLKKLMRRSQGLEDSTALQTEIANLMAEIALSLGISRDKDWRIML